MDSVNSTTFIKRPPCMTDTQEKFLYTKELLSSRIFLGYYMERRYVAALKEYRDVILVSPEETDLIQDLDKLLKKCWGTKSIKWVGLTGPDALGSPEAYCFWVKPRNLAFGHYWFQIKHVQLTEEEILLQLKCIRKAPQSAFSANPNGKQTVECKNEISEPSTSFYKPFNSINVFFNAKVIILSLTEACNNAMHAMLPYLTWKNVYETIKVTCALAIFLVMGIISLIGHLGEYLIKLIREISILVHAFTPIALKIIDLIGKIFGGFYILIVGMFFRNVHRFPVQSLVKNNLYSTPALTSGGDFQTFHTDWKERNRILRQELQPDKFKR